MTNEEILNLSKSIKQLNEALTKQAAVAERWKLCAVELAKAYRSGSGYRISTALETFDKLSET